MKPKITRAGIVLAVALLAACAPQNATVTPPPPPRVTVAAAVNALASGLDVAVTAMIAARDQGKLSQADLNAANQVVATLARAGKQVDAELRSTDEWGSQQAKILTIVVAAGVRQSAAALQPTAKAILEASLFVWSQISTSVGGPTI